MQIAAVVIDLTIATTILALRSPNDLLLLFQRHCWKDLRLLCDSNDALLCCLYYYRLSNDERAVRTKANARDCVSVLAIARAGKRGSSSH